MKKKNNIQVHLLLPPVVAILLIYSCVKDVVIPAPEYYASISTGGFHTLALEPDGTLWAWGDNSHGQIGDGTFENKRRPVRIGTDYSDISAGLNFSMALKTDGTLWTWGSNTDGQLGNGNSLAQSFQPTPVQIGTGYQTYFG